MNIYSRSKGQIMPVSLFGTAVLALAMLAVFNTSQLSSKKQRLNNATDAAAYSAAVFQARALNSVAYTNRAMVANQVFIGQMVTLNNYFGYWTKKSANLSAVPIPGFSQFFAAINSGLNGARPVVDALTKGSIQTSLAVNFLLTQHQQLVVSTGGVQIVATVDRVLAANDPDIVITPHGAVWLERNVRRWHESLERKDTSEDLIAKGRMINESRDRFTSVRNYDTTVVGFPKVEVEKLGRTDLTWEETGSDVNFRWDALDILSTTRKSGGFFGKTKNLAPIGWSRRSVSGDKEAWTCPSSRFNCDAGRKHEPTMELAEKDNNESLDGALKFTLQPYYELNEDTGYDPRFPVSVSAAYNLAAIATSDNLATLGSSSAQGATENELAPGVFHLDSAPLNDTLEAVSKAEIFFRRPVERVAGRYGADSNQDEFANVWNPYWSARLVDVTSERFAARVLKGL